MTLFRVSVVYFTILIGIRLSGKRDVGAMSPFDMILLLLISETVQNAMVGQDTSLGTGLTAAITLLVLHFILARLSWRFRAFRHVIEGTPTLLAHRGKVLEKNMRSEKVTYDELKQAMRENDVAAIEDIGLAMLEIDGSISIIKKEDLKIAKEPSNE